MRRGCCARSRPSSASRQPASCRDGRCRRRAPPRSRWRCGSPARGAVMRTVHEEAPGRDRLQSGEARLHPVLGRNALEAHRIGGRRPGDERHQRSHRGHVRRRGKVQRHAPAAGGLLVNSRGRSPGVIGLGDDVCDALRRLLVGIEPPDHTCATFSLALEIIDLPIKVGDCPHSSPRRKLRGQGREAS